MFTRPPSDPTQIRAELALPPEEKVALIVAGSLGLGEVDQTARLVARQPGWTPVVVCGHNEPLRRAVQASGSGVALGWVEDMAGLMDAADVLVDNAGGLSAKEALCRGLPVVTYRPISGHGRDDAMALERLGLTDVVDEASTLTDKLDQLPANSTERAARTGRGRELLAGDPVREIERLAGQPAPATKRVMTA